MKKLMLISCVVLCFGKTHALILPVPTYELPEGMTEHDFAVSYITGGEHTGKDWTDMSQEEQLLTHSKDKKFRSLGDDVKLSAYCEVLATNKDTPENVKAIASGLSGLYGRLGNDVLLPVYEEVLFANMDKPEYANAILGSFVDYDGRNLTSCGDQEALRLTRELVSRGADVPWAALTYLTLKGNGNDVGLIEKAKTQVPEEFRQELADTLRRRVEENFVIPSLSHPFAGTDQVIIPSVANTGPQGVYAYYILREVGNRDEYWTTVWLEDKSGRKILKLPEELLKMVITFDENGNPVSNVDLAKYRLSMPVITPITDSRVKSFRYDIVFPHKTEVTAPTPPPAVNPPEPIPDIEPTPPTDTTQDTPPPEQPQTPPKNKNPLWLGILTLAVISAVTVWSLAKRKR